jgi:hypothetical protein
MLNLSTIERGRKLTVAVKYDTEFVIRPPHPSMSATYIFVLVIIEYAEILVIPTMYELE